MEAGTEDGEREEGKEERRSERKNSGLNGIRCSASVMGSNHVQARIFFRLQFHSCLYMAAYITAMINDVLIKLMFTT